MLKADPDVYKRFVCSYYVTKDPAHNLRHIERIFSRLDALSQGMPPPHNPLLYFLTYFHGLDQRLQTDATFRQVTTLFLNDLEWTTSEIEAAFQSLNRHLKNPQSAEEMIVHDANFVELLGAFGIAKAFTVGGAKGQSFEETVRIFERYLHTTEFYTPAGKRIAQTRKAYTLNFLQQLKSEW